MDLTYLMDLVNAKINDDARRSGVMTLDSLRSQLALLPPEAPVTTDRGAIEGVLKVLDPRRTHVVVVLDVGGLKAEFHLLPDAAVEVGRRA